MKSIFGWLGARARRIMSLGGAVGSIVALGAALPIAMGDDTKPVAPQEFYKVQLVRPAKAGDRWHMRRDIEQSISESAESNGKAEAPQSGGLQIKFSGTLEVLAAGRQGEAEKLKVSAGVVSVRRAGSAGHETLVKPGTEFIVAWSGGKATVADSDAQHPLSEDAKKFLPIVFEATGAKGDSSLAEIVDSASEAKGTSWSVNTKAAAADLHAFDPKMKPSQVSGTARIKAVVGEGDKMVLSVEYEFKATTNTPASPPAGMTPAGATRIETGTVMVPADLATGYFSAKTLIHTTGKFKKTKTEKKSVRSGNKTVTKNVTVNEEMVVDELEKVNTLLTYGDGAEPGKTTSPSPSASPSTAKPATPILPLP